MSALSPQQFGHAQVFVMGGAPPTYPHAFMPVCSHPDHETEWNGSVHRGNDTESQGWHDAWTEAKAHDIRHHTSSDAMQKPNYDAEDPFAPRRVKT